MKIRVYKTNRRITQSGYLTKCIEQDGILGNIEMNHVTNIDDILDDRPYRVDPGSNLKRANDDWSDWLELADRIAKPGVIGKLAGLFKR